MINTEQSVFDIPRRKRVRSRKNLKKLNDEVSVFRIKVNSDEYEALCSYQEIYEKAHQTYKPIEAMIKGIVFEEVYSKLKPCHRKREWR